MAGDAAGTRRVIREKGSDFDAYASSYDRTVEAAVNVPGMRASHFPRSRARYLATRLQLGPRARVLDYGCGTGNLSTALLALLPQIEIDGYDPSPDSVAAVPAQVAARGRFTSDATHLGDGYDAILLSMVLHHVDPPERDGLLRQLGERLTPGGLLVLFEHNPHNPVTRRIVDRCPFDEGVELVSPGEADRRLTAAGLQRVRRDFTGFLPPPLSRLEVLLGWCPLGAQYAAVGRRTG